MKTDPRPALRAFIQRTFLRGKPERLTDDLPIFARGLVDSLGVFLIVAFVEKEFGVKVGPADLTLRHFESLETIARLVEAKAAASPSARKRRRA